MRTTTPPAAPGETETQPASARPAGVLYLIIIVFGIGAEAIRTTLTADRASAAERIRDTEWLFRVGFTASIAYILCEVVLIVILYNMFRPVDRTVSLVAAAFRVISLAVYAANAVHLLAAAVVLRDPAHPEPLALLFIDLYGYGYAIGLTFFALNCFAMGRLLAAYGAPRLLGPLLTVSGVAYLINSALFFLVPGYTGTLTPVILLPALVAEVWLCVWLLRGGTRRTGDQARRAGELAVAVGVPEEDRGGVSHGGRSAR